MQFDTIHITDILKLSALPTVVYGTGNGAEKLINTLADYGIKTDGVFASDDFKKGKMFCGIQVEHLADIKNKFEKFNTVLGFATDRKELLEKIKQLKIQLGGRVYMPEVPVFGDGFLTSEYLEARKNDVERVYNGLYDDYSKKVFRKIIEFKLSGNIDLLFETETDKREIYVNFLRPAPGEVFVDAGAYDGDTVIEFAKFAKDYGHITAIEPAPKNFEKLLKNTACLPKEKFTAIFAALSDKNGTAALSAPSGRSPFVTDCGKSDCRTVTLDSLNLAPNFIKYDVEGAEMQALAGSKKTINKYLPKLQISVYHKLGDFLDIPLAVLDISNDYNLILRHHPYLPSWETNLYAVPKNK